MPILLSLDYLKISSEKISDFEENFTIEPLSPGYGVTLGNALRRVCLSSLPGSAITSVKINDVTHEFSPIKGVKEDAVELILNLKSLRVKKFTAEPAILKLKVSGPKTITAKDFEKNPDIEIIDPNHLIATIDKGGSLTLEATVESGKGYYPVEKQSKEKLPFGMIAVDANFTPIKKIHFDISNTRVGQETDYDKLVFSITTDGSITAREALSTACQIINEHLEKISSSIMPLPIAEEKTEKKKIAKKKKEKDAPKNT